MRRDDRTADDAPRWTAQDVPPGRYRLVASSGLNVSGTVKVALGRPDQMLTSCTFGRQRAGPDRCVIALPAGASALWVGADAALARTVEQLAMTLVEPGASDGVRAPRPTRSSTSVRARSLSSVGAPGPKAPDCGRPAAARSRWSPSGRLPLSLRIRQGGAAGAVSSGRARGAMRRQLAAGEVWDIDVPRRSADGAVPVAIATAAAFRPSDLDASSTDTRLLGAWVEPR